MANPSSRTFANGPNKPGAWFSVEDLLNDLTTLYLSSNTVKALAVGIVDSAGTQINPPSVATGVVSGTKTVTNAGTAVRITATPTTIKGIWVNADLIAGIVVTVGDSSVVGNASGMKGIVLTPGNPPIFLAINALSLLWVDSQTNGGKLAYFYTT